MQLAVYVKVSAYYKGAIAQGRIVMDMEFSPEDLAFQKEVRDFIAENYPAELRGKQDEGDELTKEDFLAWHKILYKKGWVAPAWPVNMAAPAGPRRSASSFRKKPRAPIVSA